MDFNDLTLQKNYSGFRALFRARRANDWLGLLFAEKFADVRANLILLDPGMVDTGFGDAIPQPLRTVMQLVNRLIAQKPDSFVQASVRPLLQNPPAQKLTIYQKTKPITLMGDSTNRAMAETYWQTASQLIQPYHPQLR